MEERDLERNMKIKLHNSLSKFDKGICLRFLFDEKIFINSCGSYLHLCYRIDDEFYFLSFSPATKEFEEDFGFGINYKHFNPGWWKDFNWIEMD